MGVEILSERSCEPTGWKGERTVPTLKTAVVLLLIVYPHLNDFARVDGESGATNNSFVVL